LETIDYNLKSFYDNEGKHLIKGFLIGTKIADNKNGLRWSVDKHTLKDLVHQFEQEQYGDIVFAPKSLTGSKDDHPWGDNFEHQFQYQKQFTKAKLRKLYGPFDYEDGSDDYYYKFTGEVFDKPVSNALRTGELPYSVSPMIYPTDEAGNVLNYEIPNKIGVKYWKPAHIAIVPEGAFGPQAIIEKQCFGDEGKCFAALAASAANVNVAEIISSQLLSQGQNSTIMSDANPQNLSGPAQNANSNVPQVNNAPVKVETQNTPNPVQTQVQTPTQVSVEEFTKLQTELAAQTKINEKLVLKQKTDTLNKIFGNVKDENERTKIIKKWVGEDVDILADFHSDILNYVVAPQALKETKKEEKPALAASAEEEEDCGCNKNKNKEKTKFPLAGSTSTGSSRLDRERSLTDLLGGAW
jgi:hypothetical protein